ncbi:MAG: hypothetical protein ACPGR8_14945 [Limisphaerales bacterium]
MATHTATIQRDGNVAAGALIAVSNNGAQIVLMCSLPDDFAALLRVIRQGCTDVGAAEIHGAAAGFQSLKAMLKAGYLIAGDAHSLALTLGCSDAAAQAILDEQTTNAHGDNWAAFAAHMGKVHPGPVAIPVHLPVGAAQSLY